MHVIGHYHPLLQLVSFALEKKKRFANNTRNFRPSEVALTDTAIQILFEVATKAPIRRDSSVQQAAFDTLA